MTLESMSWRHAQGFACPRLHIYVIGPKSLILKNEYN